MKSKVVLDTTIGPQPHINVKVELSKDGNGKKYTFVVSKPNGDPLMDPVEIEDPMDAVSIVFVLSKAMAMVETLNYGYNNVPYLWDENHWVAADDWMKTLSFSMHGLLRTGEYTGKASRCFYNTMRSAWSAANRKALGLKPFGICKGVPLIDGVFNVLTAAEVDPTELLVIARDKDGRVVHELPPESSTEEWLSMTPPAPGNENLHVLPVRVLMVGKKFGELKQGLCDDSILLKFLRSSLNPDQIVALQRWFGLHLVIHRVGNPEKMLYLYGPGGNGKGVVVNLLRALVTNDAVATLQLSDLKISANLELLVGKSAMIGSETNAQTTDNKALKTIVSWEGINVNPKYRDPYEFRPQCLVTQASNEPPEFNDDSDAMVRRVIAIQMKFQPTIDEKIVDIAEKVKKDEYALLVAWAMVGAYDILAAGTITVPPSVLEHSARVVRPVRAVDRFIDSIETGNFEVAEDELYAAYGILCSRQGLELSPKREFFDDLDKRMNRMGMLFERRAKATGYQPQGYVHENGKHLLLAPQLMDTEQTNLYLGFRIQAGEFGPAIGPRILVSRRDVPDFEHLAAVAK